VYPKKAAAKKKPKRPLSVALGAEELRILRFCCLHPGQTRAVLERHRTSAVRLEDMKARIGSLESKITVMQNDVTRMDHRLDRVETRLGRIEKRLDLVEDYRFSTIQVITQVYR